MPTDKTKKLPSRKTRQAPKEVVLSVRQYSDFDHYVSPHLVDLRPEPSAWRQPLVDEPLFDVPAKPLASLSFKKPIRSIEPQPWPAEIPTTFTRPTKRRFDFSAQLKNILSTLWWPMRQIKNFGQAVSRMINNFSWPTWRYEFRPLKALAGFVVVGLLLVLPLSGFSYFQEIQDKRDRVLQDGQVALDSLRQANFDQAYQNFYNAQAEIDDINSLLKTVVGLLPSFGQSLESAQNLTAAGKNLSLIAQDLSTALEGLQSPDLTILDKIKVLNERLKIIQPRVAEASRQLAQVDAHVLPDKYQAAFITAQQKMPLISGSVDYLVEISDLVINFLGDGQLRRYLVLFQNNNEIRPTGGFIGSYALVDISAGQIRNIEVPGGGSYDLQGSLQAKLASPEPLRLLNARWEFQDSNWFPDWPTSAEKIMWFYRQAGGPTVDGVVAINSDLARDLLAILGPLDMTEYGKTITADNFYDETQKAVELEYDKQENRPKEFIGGLVPKLLEKVLTVSPQQGLKTATLLHDSLSNKDLQIYSTNEVLQRSLRSLGWSNEIVPTSGDYVMIVNANIAGEKTDLVMSQDVTHEARVYDDGSIIATTTITRTHTGQAGLPFTGVPNVNYLRLYVPQGSTLIAASGFDYPELKLFDYPAEDYVTDQDLLKISGTVDVDFETGVAINNEFGKTVFAGWTQTNPGQTSIVTFTYRLPFRLNFTKNLAQTNFLDRLEQHFDLVTETANYSLIVQKQSGQEGRFTSRLILPDGWQLHWRYPDSLSFERGVVNYQTDLTKDQAYGAVFIRPQL